jgi:hypothetical protein
MNCANNKTSTYVNLNCDYCKNVLISNKEIINAPCYNDFDNSFYCEDCIELVQENDRQFLEAEARQEGYFNRVLGGIHPDDNYLFIHRGNKYRYEETHNCRCCGVNEPLSGYMCKSCLDYIDDEYEIMMMSNKDN